MRMNMPILMRKERLKENRQSPFRGFRFVEGLGVKKGCLKS